MQRVTKIKTHDGALHDNTSAAKKYLDTQYADLLCKLAHKFVSAEKYSKICDLLDTSLRDFAKLIEIKKDMSESQLEDE